MRTGLIRRDKRRALLPSPPARKRSAGLWLAWVLMGGEACCFGPAAWRVAITSHYAIKLCYHERGIKSQAARLAWEAWLRADRLDGAAPRRVLSYSDVAQARSSLRNVATSEGSVWSDISKLAHARAAMGW